MVNYIIRVTFGEGESAAYTSLSTELAKYNISGAIKADDDKGYYLPLGEYCYAGNETINEVRDAIQGMANTIKAGASVMVMEITTVSWSGLKLV